MNGYRMPAEWEPHEAVWLAWPWDPDYFGPIADIEKTFVEIIDALHGSERVELLVLHEDMRHRAEKLLARTDHVRFHIRDYADVWFRDFGPIFVTDGSTLAMTDWKYNGYAKFPELLKDDAIPSWMNQFLKLSKQEPSLVLEGGAIEVNGNGVLITTEECVRNENRNPGISKEQAEQYFKDYLGAQKIIWLPQGLAHDHTDGHIDNVARFVNETTILCSDEPDTSKPNHARLKKNRDILAEATDMQGKSFTLLTLPLPQELYNEKQGEWMATSYANFYIGNTVVLVPIFHHEHDAEALRIIGSVFPTRRVIGIDCSRLISGGGTIHCISQQQPRI